MTRQNGFMQYNVHLSEKPGRIQKSWSVKSQWTSYLIQPIGVPQTQLYFLAPSEGQVDQEPQQISKHMHTFFDGILWSEAFYTMKFWSVTNEHRYVLMNAH